jgi:hypothetical protein
MVDPTDPKVVLDAGGRAGKMARASRGRLRSALSGALKSQGDPAENRGNLKYEKPLLLQPV